MNANHRYHYSVVEFRGDEASRVAGRVHLGFLIGFETERYWVIALAMRATLEEHLLNELDPLSRDIVENRSVVLSGEIDAATDDHRRPEDVLKIVAQRNQWSIYVAPPKEGQADISKYRDFSVEKIAEDYMFTLYTKETKEEDALESIRMGAFAIAAAPNRDETFQNIPPPWMLPPRVWMRPKTGA